MNTIFETRYACSPREFEQMNTTQLRGAFLIEDLFEAEKIKWVYTHFDRYMAGGAMPVMQRISLDTIDPLKAKFFMERRELGIVNVGGPGRVHADEESFELNYKEALYLGSGKQNLYFSSEDASKPAKFYLNSAPAHKSYPSKKNILADSPLAILGSQENANLRGVNKLLTTPQIQSCQLQMGLTELRTGSIWNTMPPHTHDRRMEIYFYFELPDQQAVCHFLGQPNETRHIWMRNEQAVIIPPWSIHAGAGSSNYSFIWGMAGENQDYNDMDSAPICELR
jgi:4-deoxy-L-threo-5-hexosulose-uronate ketol-isomerase